MPNRRFETFLFALFNENQKPGPIAERNWGLFRPDFSPVYDSGILRNAQRPVAPVQPRPVTPVRPRPAVGSWCVPKPDASNAALQANINYVCSQKS